MEPKEIPILIKGWEEKELKRFGKSARKVVSQESQGESLNLVAKGKSFLREVSRRSCRIGKKENENFLLLFEHTSSCRLPLINSLPRV